MKHDGISRGEERQTQTNTETQTEKVTDTSRYADPNTQAQMWRKSDKYTHRPTNTNTETQLNRHTDTVVVCSTHLENHRKDCKDSELLQDGRPV